ncbi:MAG: hypothetical protein MnENMB40S_09310 [Rhizobiaceae bacterium MnEN-MB40S]|nr:MAG: hypothetical protein MnENMB40S_09310 [Rhizobiaceae bacterium MnEN-MB40S]
MKGSRGRRRIAVISRQGDLIVSHGSVHKLVEGAVAVCTINLGVGTEALLQLKPVYLFGGAGYLGACFVMRDKGEFARQFQGDKLPLDEAFIKKFLYVCRNQFQLDINADTFRKQLENRLLHLIADRSSNAAVQD